MIRMVWIGVALLTVTITLIVIQPSSPNIDARSGVDSFPVTRAQTDYGPVIRTGPTYHTHPVEETSSMQQLAESAKTDRGPFEAMVISALQQGQSHHYIGARVIQALIEAPSNIAVDEELVIPAQ